jgi:hypothetical protein
MSLPTFQMLYCIALMMEAVQTSETMVNSYHSTQSYNPEDSHLQRITTSAYSSESDLWYLQMIPVISKLEIPTWMHACLSRWGFPTQSRPHAEKHLGLHVKYLLLVFNFNQNWDVLTNFSETPQYQISWNSVQWF